MANFSAFAAQSWPWVLWMVAAGACVGSFINVLALHWPRRLKLQWNQDVADYLACTPESLGLSSAANLDTDNNGLMRRSRCPHCGTVLGWWQLIPLFSFFLLRGQCHHCKQRISWRYPAVEACAGLLFGLVAWQQPPGLAALILAGVLSALLLLSLIDLDEMLLPDDLTLPLMWLGLLHAVLWAPDTTTERLIGAMAGYASLWTVYQVFRLMTGREGMGYGDFKLLAALGAWLGWVALLPIALTASLAGSIWGLSLIATGRSDRQKPIPFGPWLALAGALEILELNPASAWLRALT